MAKKRENLKEIGLAELEEKLLSLRENLRALRFKVE